MNRGENLGILRHETVQELQAESFELKMDITAVISDIEKSLLHHKTLLSVKKIERGEAQQIFLQIIIKRQLLLLFPVAYRSIEFNLIKVGTVHFSVEGAGLLEGECLIVGKLQPGDKLMQFLVAVKLQDQVLNLTSRRHGFLDFKESQTAELKIIHVQLFVNLERKLIHRKGITHGKVIGCGIHPDHRFHQSSAEGGTGIEVTLQGLTHEQSGQFGRVGQFDIKFEIVVPYA